MFKGSLKTAQGVRRVRKKVSCYLILGNPRLHMQAREGVGRRGRETEKAGRQTGIRTKGGEESGRKYQLQTEKKEK